MVTLRHIILACFACLILGGCSGNHTLPPSALGGPKSCEPREACRLNLETGSIQKLEPTTVHHQDNLLIFQEPFAPIGILIGALFVGAVTAAAIKRGILGDVGAEALDTAMDASKEKIAIAKKTGGVILRIRSQVSSASVILFTLCAAIWDRLANWVDPAVQPNKNIDD